MANPTLFTSYPGRLIPHADAINHEFAPAYAFPPKHQLAQMVMTGCLNGTFYANARLQLDGILHLCGEVDADFIARTALYARKHGFMKDTPALLCAVLAVRDGTLLKCVFTRVIDNAKMLRNFVQILRSGVVGRKSLGSLPKRLVREWLESRRDDAIFRASVGQKPSLADIVRMVHPRPSSPSRQALYGYLLNREHDAAALPELVRHFEDYRSGRTPDVPEVPFEKLTALELPSEAWTAIARHAGWHMTRMNLNTFSRHGVFDRADSPEIIRILADRLRDPEEIAASRVFPYQLMMAYMMAGKEIPTAICEALQDAMETATANVPAFGGKVYVCPDVSGSMRSPATGYRLGATSAIRCIDVAGLIAASILRKNREAEIIPFDFDVIDVHLNPRDSVMTNAAKLASAGGGGTDCSAPLLFLNRQKRSGDLIVFISDNESWVDTQWGGGTAMMQQRAIFKQRNPRARLVCLDLQPYRTTQAAEREDILNIGGFSDQVFEVIAEFAAGRLNSAHWVGVIEKEDL